MRLFAAFLLALVPAFAFSQTPAQTGMAVKGIAVPAVAEAAGKKLVLNGAGGRVKVVFNVYVGALYLEERSSDAADIINQDKTRRMEMTFLRNVDSAAIGEAIEKGFNSNSAAALPALKARLSDFRKLIPDLRKGDRLVFTYSPAAGLIIEHNGKQTGSIPGADFAAALFASWLGDNPADKNLKKTLLSGNR
jgi:hypothetical protein